jgi:hypothetical protein
MEMRWGWREDGGRLWDACHRFCQSRQTEGMMSCPAETLFVFAAAVFGESFVRCGPSVRICRDVLVFSLLVPVGGCRLCLHCLCLVRLVRIHLVTLCCSFLSAVLYLRRELERIQESHNTEHLHLLYLYDIRGLRCQERVPVALPNIIIIYFSSLHR